MLSLNCPSCGALVNFQSKASVFAVCSFCKSSLVRQDLDLSKIGSMADLQDDFTPLQIGTTGLYLGKKFELVGRLKIGYSEGFWNEWYALFNDSSGAENGWLTDAQGFYALCSPGIDVNLPARDDISVGALLDLSPHGYFDVEDVHTVKCLFSEGELPLDAHQGRRSVSVDLTSKGCKMATIEYAEKETRCFFGTYHDFDTFKFQNLRHIDGW